MAIGLAIPLSAALLYLAKADLLHENARSYRQITTYANETVIDSIQLIKPLVALILLGFSHPRARVRLPAASDTFCHLAENIGHIVPADLARDRNRRRDSAAADVCGISLPAADSPAALLFGILARGSTVPFRWRQRCCRSSFSVSTQAQIIIRTTWQSQDRLAVQRLSGQPR